MPRAASGPNTQSGRRGSLIRRTSSSGPVAAPRLLRSEKPRWLDVQRDGLVVFGAAIDELKSRPRA